jgi:hypothetical protein
MTRIRSSWRKAPKPIELPKPTDSDRQAAIDKLAEIDDQRGNVVTLQKAADKARSERDKAREVFDQCQDVYASAQRKASCLGASLDSRARRQHAILRKTCSPLIGEFIETVSSLLGDVRNEGILKSAPPSGKYTMDGHKHKQPWSTFATAAERSNALVDARRAAEAMRFSTMTEEDVEAALQKLFDELPTVDYQHC